MFIRPPASQSLANSNARLALLLRSGNGSRVIEIGDRTLTAFILVSLLLLAWYLVATLYLVSRDDFVMSMLNGERRHDYAYEERIAQMRARIDKLTARQVINQDTIDDRVASIMARQAELEARQLMVADIGTRAAQAGIPLNSGAAAPLTFTATAASRNANAVGGPVSPPARSRPVPIEPLSPTSPGGFDELKMRGAIRSVVDEVERRTERMERSQIEALETIAAIATTSAAAGQQAVFATGLRPARFGKYLPSSQQAASLAEPQGFALRNVENPANAMGGPFFPVDGASAAEMFESRVSRAERALTDAHNSRIVMRALPLGRPLPAEHMTTSGFGTRLDPFTRSFAQHSGIDFRAPSGTPVRATATGKVFDAGANGGYGRMIEIDHGFGLSTRYAHLTSIHVKEGDVVKKGDVIGTVGSTGRSTGPHLHYEVRIDDDATDPMRFLRAARLVSASAR